jgi:hypothetical protein
MQMNRDDGDNLLRACLELIISGQETLDSVLTRYPEQADMLRPQLESLLWLRNINQDLDPRPGFVAASRKRLMAKIQQESVADRVENPAPERGFFDLFFSRRFATPLLVAFILMISLYVAGNGLYLASQNAIPGDRLYSVKIMFERTALAFSRDNTNDAKLQMEFTQRRSEEIYQLVAQGRYEYIPDTVKNFENSVDQTIQSLNEVAVQNDNQARQLAGDLEDYLTHQRAVLLGLIQNAPSVTGPAITAAIQASVKGSNDARSVGGGSPPVATATPFPPPRPTQPPTATATPRPTSTRPPLPTPTAAPTETSLPTNTRPPTHTPRPTNTPLPPPTNTPLPPPTNTPLPPPTNTPTPPPTNTPTPPPTNTPTPTNTITPSATATSTETPVPTSTPAPTFTPTETLTPIPGDGKNPTSTSMPVVAETPTNVPVLLWSYP